jgi:hypothetical protein
MKKIEYRNRRSQQLLLIVAMLVVNLLVSALPAKAQTVEADAAEELNGEALTGEALISEAQIGEEYVTEAHVIEVSAQSDKLFLPAVQGGSGDSSQPSGTEFPFITDNSTPLRGQSGDVIWSANFDAGTFPGSVAISGLAWPALSTAQTRSGRYSAALTILYANGMQRPEPGVRLGYHAHGEVARTDPKNLPDEAYYSSHYYFPSTVKAEWWNLMQWKQSMLTSPGVQTRIPVYFVSGVYLGGAMRFILRSKVSATGEFTQPGSTLAIAKVPIPTKSWVRLECLYRWSKEATGRIACWQNGVLLWDIKNIVTEFKVPYVDYPRQWAVNNYAGKTDPIHHVIYVDDLAVRTTPLGAP